MVFVWALTAFFIGFTLSALLVAPLAAVSHMKHLSGMASDVIRA